MKAVEVIFRSGQARTLYGKTVEEALKALEDDAEVDCVIELMPHFEREATFRQQNEAFLKNKATAEGKQATDIKKALHDYAQTLGARSLV